jgi:hypothetical protein
MCYHDWLTIGGDYGDSDDGDGGGSVSSGDGGVGVDGGISIAVDGGVGGNDVTNTGNTGDGGVGVDGVVVDGGSGGGDGGTDAGDGVHLCLFICVVLMTLSRAHLLIHKSQNPSGYTEVTAGVNLIQSFRAFPEADQDTWTLAVALLPKVSPSIFKPCFSHLKNGSNTTYQKSYKTEMSL